MNLIPLSTNQAPPISVPFRFFAVAPLFLLLAALLLVQGSYNPFVHSRTPALLAATHGITLGFLSMIMLGAVQQILPVVIGSTLPAPRLVAWSTQLLLIAGTLLLCFGFLHSQPELLNLAWPLLGVAFIMFTVATLISLARAAARNASRTAIFLAILSLLAAVIIGALLAYGHATGLSLDYLRLAAAHVSMALGGWVLLLAVGVSYQVVPMFQLTPGYPKWLTSRLAPAIFAVLLLHLILLLTELAPHWLQIASETLFWMCAILFGSATLLVQFLRKRSVPDATLSFFRFGMACLLALSLLAMSLQYFSESDFFYMLGGILFLLGFAMSLLFGMLYKIIPFLVWFHLFRSGTKIDFPNVKEIIPEQWKVRHLWLHGGTVTAAILSLWWDTAVWLLALCLTLEGLLFGWLLFVAIRIYRSILRLIELEK